ncbi:GTPase-activating protein gyp8, partial [Coemansia erecta]
MQSRRARKSPSRIQQISQAISGRDLASLKHLARTGDGLVTTRLRRRAWPLLLNFRSLLDPGTHHDKHPDEPQVALDVPRTHVFQSNELRRSDDGVRRRQEQLHGVVNGVLRAYPWLRYYQGFHELAMPFVCVFGSAGAAREALRMVALFFVRDALASG